MSNEKKNKPILLIIDDEADVRRGLKRIFVDDYTVIEARSAPETLSLINAGLQPDFILSDIRISIEMNGIELLKRLRDHGIIAPALFVSAYLTREYIDAIKTIPFTSYIGKDFEVEALLAKMNELLGKKAAA